MGYSVKIILDPWPWWWKRVFIHHHHRGNLFSVPSRRVVGPMASGSLSLQLGEAGGCVSAVKKSLGSPRRSRRALRKAINRLASGFALQAMPDRSPETTKPLYFLSSACSAVKKNLDSSRRALRKAINRLAAPETAKPLYFLPSA